MKALFFSILLFTSLVGAFPTINDSVTYNGKFTMTREGESFTVPFIQILTLKELNAEKTHYKLLIEFFLPNGDLKDETTEVPVKDIKTVELVAEIMKNCVAIGGTLEQLTVVAGEFESCKVSDPSGATVWIGNVPFAILKQIEKDQEGNVMEIELALFEDGRHVNQP